MLDLGQSHFYHFCSSQFFLRPCSSWAIFYEPCECLWLLDGFQVVAVGSFLMYTTLCPQTPSLRRTLSLSPGPLSWTSLCGIPQNFALFSPFSRVVFSWNCCRESCHGPPKLHVWAPWSNFVMGPNAQFGWSMPTTRGHNSTRRPPSPLLPLSPPHFFLGFGPTPLGPHSSGP